jgi:hypothetical protein
VAVGKFAVSVEDAALDPNPPFINNKAIETSSNPLVISQNGTHADDGFPWCVGRSAGEDDSKDLNWRSLIKFYPKHAAQSQ